MKKGFFKRLFGHVEKSFSMETIRSTSSDDRLFEMIGAELDARLPNGRRANDDFVVELRALPVGLRAMAATYELDVSLALDDFGWHFANWHHLDLAEETVAGLDELGAASLAQIFRSALALAKPYWAELGADSFKEWYLESPLDKALGPLNEAAWALRSTGDGDILKYWVAYARKHPEKMVHV